MNNIYKNAEGYVDRTAGEAIKAADRPPENLKDMIKCMRDLADLLGYEIVGRIQVREKESGRIWR